MCCYDTYPQPGDTIAASMWQPLPGYTVPWRPPGGTGEPRRSPRTPDMAPGTSLRTSGRFRTLHIFCRMISRNYMSQFSNRVSKPILQSERWAAVKEPLHKQLKQKNESGRSNWETSRITVEFLSPGAAKPNLISEAKFSICSEGLLCVPLCYYVFGSSGVK